MVRRARWRYGENSAVKDIPGELAKAGGVMGRPKITVVGAGNVGGTTARRLAERDAYDVVLVDIVEGVPQGKALDISQAGPVCGYRTRVVGTNGYDETAGSSIAVITSGIPRKPGMSRDELLSTNAKIVKSVVSELISCSPDIILILVTNPLDAMVHVARKSAGCRKRASSAWPASWIPLGCARSLHKNSVSLAGTSKPWCWADTAIRWSPLPRYTTVKGGRLVSEMMPKTKLEAIVQRTRDNGAEIVGLLKTGSAFYAPSASAVNMVERFTKDQKRVMPCMVLCEGEYGLREVVVGVPGNPGKGGAEQVMVYDSTADEQRALEGFSQCGQ